MEDTKRSPEVLKLTNSEEINDDIDFAFKCLYKFVKPTLGDTICDVYFSGEQYYINLSRSYNKNTYGIYLGTKFPNQISATENLNFSQMKNLAIKLLQSHVIIDSKLNTIEIVCGDQLVFLKGDEISD